VIGLLTTVLVGYSGLVGLVALGCALRRVDRPRFLDAMVLSLEGLAVVRAMLGVGAMASGSHAVPGVTHLAYLVTSIAVLPLLISTLDEDRSHWSAAVIAVGCLAVLVVALRLQATW
jgi:heme A synthase